MTERKSFKRLVRTRMDKTGESYTTARASLLAARNGAAEATVLPLSDDAVRRRTGRGWEDWFGLLDDAGADELSHRDVAGWLGDHHALDDWSAQSVTVGYERARGGRAVGQRPDGFSIGVSKTVAAPVERLFDTFVEPEQRARWLPTGELRERTSTRPRSARYDWADGRTRVHVGFASKGDDKSVVSVQHERLADVAEADRMKAYWRDAVTALKDHVE